MDDLSLKIAKEIRFGAETVGETGRQFAILGTQEGIVVDETTRPYNAMWVHISGQEPFMAIDSSGQLTYDNSAGGLQVEVEIGYPAGRREGRDTPHILRITERGKQALGGITPAQMAHVRAQNPQAERLTTLRLTKGTTGLTVGMTGGWYMRGGYLDYAEPNDNIADLISYVPSTTGYSKYVVVCWDGTQAVIEERTEFDPGAFIPSDMIRGEITPGCIRLGYALLEEGVSAWADDHHVLPLPHLYNAAGETVTASAPTVTHDSDAGFAVGWFWLDTSTEDIYFCTDSTPGAAVWKITTAGGSSGNIFESLFIQGASYQHSFQTNTFSLGNYSANDAGVVETIYKARGGDIDAPADVVQNDVINQRLWLAYHSDAFRTAASDTTTVIDSSPGSGSMQTKRTFAITDSGSVSPTNVMDLTAKRVNFSVPVVVPSYTTAAIAALTGVTDGMIVYDTDTDTIKARLNGTFTTLGGGVSGITVEENNSSIVAAATTLNFVEMNVESPGGNQADVYLNLPFICTGRLTLTTGVPVTTSDVTGASTLYFTNFQHVSGGSNNLLVSLYDGTRWKLYSVSERSLALSGLTSGKNYDVFLYDNAGTVTLELLVWTNDTTRATALTTLDGVYVKSGATARRYIGTIRTTSTTTTEDSLAKRFVWNMYNRVPRQGQTINSNSSWSYSTATWRELNGGSGQTRAEFIIGLLIDHITVVGTFLQGDSNSTTLLLFMAMAFDAVDGTSTICGCKYLDDKVSSVQGGDVHRITSIGYHYYSLVEYQSTGSTATVYQSIGRCEFWM